VAVVASQLAAEEEAPFMAVRLAARAVALQTVEEVTPLVVSTLLWPPVRERINRCG
jgi:hypothetical protein